MTCSVHVLGACATQAGPGGKATLRSVERFDVGSEQWSVLGAEMGTPRKYASVSVAHHITCHRPSFKDLPH